MKKLTFMMMLLALLVMVTACGDKGTEPVVLDEEAVATTEAPAETTTEAAEDESAGAEDRMPAADFTMTDWQGNTVSLSDYEGKIVFLNFFATWCPPCQEEMPVFEEAYQDYEGDVVFLIVDVFTSERTDVAGVKEWYTDGGYTMPMIIDEEGALQQDYPVRAFPTTFIIDRDGGVLGYLEGAMDRSMVDQVVGMVE